MQTKQTSTAYVEDVLYAYRHVLVRQDRQKVLVAAVFDEIVLTALHQNNTCT